MRTLRILFMMWRASLDAELEYRLNFTIAALTSALGLTFGVLGVSLFFQGTASFPGWTFEESLAVLGVFTLLSGFVQCVLAPNLSEIVAHVENGTLDFVLLKPVDAQLWVSLREVSPWGLPDVAFGLGLCGYAAHAAHVPPSTVLPALVPLFAAVVLLYAMWFLVAATAIWFVRIANATEVLRGLLDAGRFPLAAYPAAYRAFFTFAIPVAFLTTVPAEVLLGRRALVDGLAGIAVAALVFALARWFWKVSLRSYTSASS